VNLKAVPATPGALVVDSLPFCLGGTEAAAAAMRAEGVACLVGYLGAMTCARLVMLLDAGIAFMPVTYGLDPRHYSGPASVAQAKKLGLPPDTSVWLDLEGMPAFRTDPATLIEAANAWATAIEEAGWMPCLYVGVPQPLTSDELYGLRHVRYWHGQGDIRDRENRPAAPACGWTLRQKWPSLKRGGVLVDDNTLQPDLLGRVPNWVIAAEEDTQPEIRLDSPDLDDDGSPGEAA
jgi:hypothetical protein